MDEHVRETLFDLCNFFDVISRKSITVKKLKRIREEIIVILCELEMYLPPAFFDVMVHLLVHIPEDISNLGPTFLHSMMAYERMNGMMKGYVRNRAHPDGSIVQGFLTEECVSFYQNYLNTDDPIGLPVNKHFGRLDGVGHKIGMREMHVGHCDRLADFGRANLVALQHLEIVDPWVTKHKTMIAEKYRHLKTEADIIREHNSTFLRWFKEELLVNPPSMTSMDEKVLFALSQGPAPNLATYQAYDINGYTFYTEEKDKNSEHQNSGVTMLSYTGPEKDRYYGRIEEIWELNYIGEKVPMFRVRWAKQIQKENNGYFTTMCIPPPAQSKSVGANVTAKNEPWVLASQVDQCFFITDPTRPSRVVVRRGKRNIIGMDGVAHEQDFDMYGDPKIEDTDDEEEYTPRRTRTTLPKKGLPFKRRSHDVGLNYTTSGRKGKKKMAVKRMRNPS